MAGSNVLFLLLSLGWCKSKHWLFQPSFPVWARDIPAKTSLVLFGRPRRQQVAKKLRADNSMKDEYYRLHVDRSAAAQYQQYQAGARFARNQLLLDDDDVDRFRGEVQVRRTGDRVKTVELPDALPIYGDGRQNDTTLAQHHVVPLEHIVTQLRQEIQTKFVDPVAVKKNRNRGPDDRVEEFTNRERAKLKEYLEKFLNHRFNRDLITDLRQRHAAAPGNFLGDSDSMGSWIYGAITYNPNNLVFGPVGDFRANDPSNGIDREILDAQPKDVRKVWRRASDLFPEPPKQRWDATQRSAGAETTHDSEPADSAANESSVLGTGSCWRQV